jgi:hypothetical protein
MGALKGKGTIALIKGTTADCYTACVTALVRLKKSSLVQNRDTTRHLS